MKREIIIKSSDALGNEIQRTFSNVNPEATPAQIDSGARALMNLSQNTYIDTIRRDEQSINEALAD